MTVVYSSLKTRRRRTTPQYQYRAGVGGARMRLYFYSPPRTCAIPRGAYTSALPLTNAAEVFEIILCSFFFVSVVIIFFSVRFLFCAKELFIKNNKNQKKIDSTLNNSYNSQIWCSLNCYNNILDRNIRKYT